MIDDRAFNYTTPENQATGLRMPEHAIRQLIGYSLRQIALAVDDLKHNLIDELFARVPLDTRLQIKEWLRTHLNIPVVVNWPRDDQSLPFIAVVNESSVEADDALMLGNYGGTQVLGSGDSQTVREVRRLPDRNTSTVYVASDDPNLTAYLSALVRFIVVSNADDLTSYYDMHSLSVSTHDVKWDERFLPTFCYVRAMSMSYLTYFDYFVGEGAAKIVSLALMVATLDEAGVEVIVDAPYPEDDQ